MKAFVSAIILALTASAAADLGPVPNGPGPNGPAPQGAHGHYELNNHFDNNDAGHQHYGSDSPASPAFPNAPNFREAVDAFDTYGTLFGEHRYQLQVAKTGNMLIGTEALRHAIADLQLRVGKAREYIHSNDGKIEANDREINWNRQQISDNRSRLQVLDGRIHDLEAGYSELHGKMAVDREALVMMCHQYAYAEKLPKECVPIVGNMAKPLEFRWHFPDVDCPSDAPLPPFPHDTPHYDLPKDY